jgi:hypothetical protein
MMFRIAAAALVPLIMTVSAPPARAQAWLPPQGEGTVSVLFSDVFAKYHYLPTTPLDFGHIRTETLLVDVTYGLTDKVAVTVGIPWVASKYTGAFPHPLADLTGVTPLDDGGYHQTFQDFRFDVRYNVTKKGLVLTPFIGSIVPSHDYTYFAHTAPGRDLNELQLGVSAARMLDALVPGLFLQGSYLYGVTEKVLDIPHNRSNMSLEVGYFVTPRVRLLGLSTGQLTHGGVDAPSPTDPIMFPEHDRITRDEFINVGGGTAYSLSEKVDIFGSVIHTLDARNIHAIHRGLSLGLSWSFSTKRSADRAIAAAEHSLVKCLCEKKPM